MLTLTSAQIRLLESEQEPGANITGLNKSYVKMQKTFLKNRKLKLLLSSSGLLTPWFIMVYHSALLPLVETST